MPSTEIGVPLARGRDVVGDLVLQLRGSPGDVLRVPAAPKADGAHHDPTWTAGQFVRLGVWLCAMFAGLIVDRVRRKSAILGGLQAWSLICLCTGFVNSFRGLLRDARGRGARRDVLLSGLHVAPQRLSRQEHALESHRLSPDQRLCRHHRRRIFRGTDRPVLRLAMVVLLFGGLGVFSASF